MQLPKTCPNCGDDFAPVEIERTYLVWTIQVGATGAKFVGEPDWTQDDNPERLSVECAYCKEPFSEEIVDELDRRLGG